ncbi:hypothetical protein B0T22DRAFT_503206 [Podospora appendiculata]|uniref:Uncharacterized protein n=1 Tax=Podospora appendiculata TaxID=314037 RepID=A0AAE0XF61_9PEZI|nr:hypothetical protein B0T22DRAFT_503206 [Podospora appendiculata]
MSAPLSIYAQLTLKLHTRMGLSPTAIRLLYAYEDFRIGRIDQDEFGRMVRTSANMRRAATDIITKAATFMTNHAEEVKHCVDMIQTCTEILRAADKPPSMVGFPLKKLPLELRHRVYDQYIRSASIPEIYSHPRKTACDCVAYCPSPYGFFQPVSLALARTSTQIRDEFLAYFYKKATVGFTCSCELLKRVTDNDILRNSVRKIRVHWTGPVSDQAFLLLAKCPGLKELEIIISKSTTAYMTKREKELRKYFTTQKPVRLVDALGIDELLLIRGIENVSVSHLNTKQGGRRVDEDKVNLRALLRSKLKLEREDD